VESLLGLVEKREKELAKTAQQLQTTADASARQAAEFRRQQDSVQRATEIIALTQENIADLEAQQNILDREIAQLRVENRQREMARRRLQAQLDGPARKAMWVGVGFAFLIGVVMLYLGGALVNCVFRQPSLTDDEAAAMEDEHARTVKQLETQMAYYRTLAHIFRQVISVQVIASGLLLVSIVAFVFIYIQDPIKLIGEDGFWKTIAAVGVPLAFVTAAYNVIEARRLELVKLHHDVRLDNTRQQRVIVPLE
jgi:hypothetical protein